MISLKCHEPQNPRPVTVTVNAYQRTQSGGDCGRGNPCRDAFVAKLNPDGNLLLYSSYLGGSGEDHAYALTVDSSGSVTLAGTAGGAFPVTPGAYQTSVRIIRNYVQWLREQEQFNATVGSPYSGVLDITQGNGFAYGLSGVFAAVRVSTKGPGRFGVFYPAVPPGLFTQRDAWLYGLQQNATSRSNLALVNLGSEFLYKIDLFDGDTGLKVATVDSITPSAWLQLNGILAQYAPGVTQGYARVSRQGGFGPFITYAVINDGGAPGERTGDGAFIASSP